ncbi:tRNA adenosine(34) deaminase TadA [Candidatus Fukatsuia anoeciicola]|uniref:tRNA adenosine(34) deaminase TadA n=1 Tax=Candidatus Fukatsuia anoeciicola TaxID=2994492 RepID=UPI003463FE33
MFTKHNDEYWMNQALILAQRAQAEGEVPVGAILILDNNIIGQGWNRPIAYHDPTAHAEIIALRQGGKKQKNYRLPNTTLYVTLEPCMMCTSAIIHSRIYRLVYGASNKKTRILSSILDILHYLGINHHIKISTGVLTEACSQLLSTFFNKQRLQQKIKKLTQQDNA